MRNQNLQSPELEAVQIGGTTRSAFLVRGTLAAGAVMGAGAISPLVSRALAQGGGDVDVLNYALALEVLEFTYYDQGLKEVSGLDSAAKRLAREIRDNEKEHVDAIKATIKQLGGKAAAAPKVDFGNAFASKGAFLKLANTLEDTGVSAYNGAAPMIVSEDVLAAAGSIVQVEARHAALIRLERGVDPAPQSFDKASSMDEVLAAVKPLIRS